VALLLRSKGIHRIRPLQGGLEAWRDAGYPMATLPITDGSMTKNLEL
jgi:rhodanese-related sulfurtransferase